MGRARVHEVRSDELTSERAEELGACYKSYVYFVSNYCKIYDSVQSAWIPFRLWRSQHRVLHDIHNNKLTVILKARQLGISWLVLGYALWESIFRPIAATSIFSRREPEAIYLMGGERLRGMYNALPIWMRSGHESTVDAAKEWILANGSAFRAFPTSAGDSYVSTLAIIDEADLAPDLNQLMRAVKPTIDNGGRMILLSRSNKSEPESEFKQIYKMAKAGENSWFPVFLPWHAHPGRTKEWYEEQKRDIVSRTGSVDDLFEQYPETDAQALSHKTLDKRIPPIWLERCCEPFFFTSKPVSGIPTLMIYHKAVPGKRYVIGADPAEGNPGSDDSALTVLEVETGEEVATFAGKFEPAIFAGYIAQISSMYNYAPAMIERNNHGHSVIQWMEEHGRRTRLLLGHDAETHKKDKASRKRRKGKYAGWMTSTLGKTILYTTAVEFFRKNANMDGEPTKVLHTLATYTQLGEIEAATLKAPTGRHDDRATSYALAVVGREQIHGRSHGAVLVMDKTKGWGT